MNSADRAYEWHRLTLQDQALAILGGFAERVADPDTAIRLDTPSARETALAQLVPVLSLLKLVARDIGTRPVLDDGVHEMLCDFARVATQLQQRWSSPDQKAARNFAEETLKTWAGSQRTVVTGLGGKVCGGVFPPGDVA